MGMSDAFAEMMLGHLVCLIQCNAFILVEWAYLGRGKLRWPVLWAELLCMGEMGLSLAAGMSFFNVQSVLLNVLYLFVTAQLFGGNFADKLTACLINGTMCLLVENTVNYTYSWFTGVRTGEAWQHPGCLIALCAANLIVGAAVAHSLYSWNQKCALQPLQALVMSFFPGVAVVLNIVLMVTGTQQPATRMTMLLTFGMSVAVLVHIAIVQMFNDQVVQRQNSRYRAQLEQQRAEAAGDRQVEALAVDNRVGFHSCIVKRLIRSIICALNELTILIYTFFCPLCSIVDRQRSINRVFQQVITLKRLCLNKLICTVRQALNDCFALRLACSRIFTAGSDFGNLDPFFAIIIGQIQRLHRGSINIFFGHTVKGDATAV